jgi:phospholipid-binding lipoprotein MlaA
LDVVNSRAELLSASEARDVSALDPYAFTRDAYYQRRKFLIFDGDPPMDDFFDDFDDLDEE